MQLALVTRYDTVRRDEADELSALGLATGVVALKLLPYTTATSSARHYFPNLIEDRRCVTEVVEDEAV